ncbi:hypothetical protein, partial [Escherichia coli]|uniref:hypothetical protein n=1 Tax=Escherichia coli TaxID=562 RepID=UPI001AA1D0BC
TGDNVVDLEEVQVPQVPATEVGPSDHQRVVADESDINTSVRRSSRIRTEPDRYLGYLEGTEVLVVAESSDEPTNYRSTMSDLESDKWLNAMNAEMQSMRDNQV